MKMHKTKTIPMFTKIVFLDASALVKYFLTAGQEKGIEIMHHLMNKINKDRNFNIIIETLGVFIEETRKILYKKYKRGCITENQYNVAMAILETSDFIHIPDIKLNERNITRKQNGNGHLYNHSNDAKYAEYISIYFKDKKLKNVIPVPVLSDKHLIKYLKKEGFDIINPEHISVKELEYRLLKSLS